VVVVADHLAQERQRRKQLSIGKTLRAAVGRVIRTRDRIRSVDFDSPNSGTLGCDLLGLHGVVWMRLLETTPG
jgi:hypothetical protein